MQTVSNFFTKFNPNFVFSYFLKEKKGKLVVEEVPRDTKQAKQVMTKLLRRVFGN